MRIPTVGPRFESGSFRDPDTKVFHHDGAVFRCLTPRALEDWEQLASTSFFERLTAEHRVIPTEQVRDRAGLPALDAKWAAVLRHETVPLVSYPYEWSFSMLRDAALLQLDVTLAALEEGMTLKDATPFNIQWVGPRPTFIDIGSFTAYHAGEPWMGYRQFCKLFLYPLLLQAYRNVSFHPWLRGSLDGIEAEQIRSMLRAQDYLRPGVLTHVHLQAKAQSRYESSVRDIRADLRAAGFDAELIKHNVARLRRLVEGLRWKQTRSTWSNYQHTHTYQSDELRDKVAFVTQALTPRRWHRVWDLGCNTGIYSRLASKHADYVLAIDADHVVIDRLYQTLQEEDCTNMLPLVSDFA
ncbi:MAG: class I SAM-dependent methyltransferase, partial [Vicinamibacterales bacterium]|nr:class I SAM-dependent methyltransferase [Vicinamibacterales bacterium]